MSNARNGLTRRRLIANAAAAGILADVGIRAAGARMLPRRMGAPQSSGTTPPPPPGRITSIGVVNPTNAALTNPTVQFFQPFAEGDLPDGSTLAITDATSAVVPYTAARRANWGEAPTNRSGADLFCRPTMSLPAKRALTGITISGTTATATSSGAHGLATNDEVLIQATVDTNIPAPNLYYYGFVKVTVINSTQFSYTVIGIVPSGPSTIPMEMCYGTRLNMNSATGTWSDTLPAGKTVSAILADLQANHDNIAIELVGLQDVLANNTAVSGTVQGSGTWSADFFTTLAQAGTDKYRVVGTGPTLLDLTGIMKFADTVGGARHASLSGWFYVSLILDPTTGAIVDIHARCFIDQTLGTVENSIFIHNTRLRLGNTIVRSWGLSSDPAIDGKKQSFASTAVNTSTRIINIPNHGFQGTERVFFTTTGTLPAPLASGTSYFIIWVDKDNIKLAVGVDGPNMTGGASAMSLTSQGTGTHTVTCIQQTPPWVRNPVIGNDARPDRWLGKTGALKPWSVHVVHDTNYMQLSRIIPPIDLRLKSAVPIAQTTNLPSIAAAIKARFVYGSAGPVQWGLDSTGGGEWHTYGANWNHVSCAHAHHPHEIGTVQMNRATTFCQTAWSFMFTDGETNWRPYVFNNGPNRAGGTYSGMGASQPTAAHYPGNFLYAGISYPRSGASFGPWMQEYSFSHRYTYLPQLYTFEGRQELHDLMVLDANFCMGYSFASVYTNPGSSIAVRTYNVSGVNYYGVFPGPSLTDRGDGQNMSLFYQVFTLMSASAPEYPYFQMVADDTIVKMNYIIFTQAALYDPNWLDFGGWYGQSLPYGPGADAWCDGAQSYLTSDLFQILQQPYRLYPTALHKKCIKQMGKLINIMYDGVTFNTSANNILYAYRTLNGLTGHVVNPNVHMPFATWKTSPIFADDAVGGWVALPDGRVLINGVGAIGLQAGDAHVITLNATNDVANQYGPIPPELVEYGKYYVFPVDGTYQSGIRYSTTPDGSGMINSYSVMSNAATISTTMTTSTNRVQTNHDLVAGGGNFGFDRGFYLITSGAGQEVVFLSTIGGVTQDYAVDRGACGTPALAHGAGATVTQLYNFGQFGNYQNRTVPFPPTGQAYRVVHNTYDFGYRTLAHYGLGVQYLAGLYDRTSFDICDKWYNDVTHNASTGGSQGAANYNGFAWTVNTDLPVLTK